MALVTKRENIKHVPWFSLAEWHKVYKQIYSNNDVDQVKAYETLLAWKERISKLPVGVDCSLSILQVCLRDREWNEKIKNGELPLYYENDLRLMYSTTIMRFLNHISNIGYTKQSSLFQIAKQLKIPEWIVNLRHDAAHGHELPSIDVLRIAINILLTWLHDEYWLPETNALEENHMKQMQLTESEDSDEVQAFADLIELWTAVSLYVRANYRFVNEIPDVQLRDTLEDLRSYVSNLSQQDCDNNGDNNQENVCITKHFKKDDVYHLSSAQAILLSEISRYLGKSKWIHKKEDVILDILLDSAAFLPNQKILSIFKKLDNDILERSLPADVVNFWQDILFLLEEKKMMEPLLHKLLKIVNDINITKEKKNVASLWIKCIVSAFIKLNIAQNISQTLEIKLRNTQKKLPFKILNQKIKEEINKTHPELKDVLWFNISSTVPHSLMDIEFVIKLIYNANEFTNNYIAAFLELITPKLNNDKKNRLIDLIDIYTLGRNAEKENAENKSEEKEFTIEGLRKIREENMQFDCCKDNVEKQNLILADRVVRNNHWQLASGDYQWAAFPIGVLPWQFETLEMLEPLETKTSNYAILNDESVIVPGIIDSENLKMRSRINWNSILREKKRQKKKQKIEHPVIDRAIQIAKIRD